MIEVVVGDSMEVMKKYPDRHFTTACFSPAYGYEGEFVFDVLKDFKEGGKFIEYGLEISRVSRIWAVNFTQVVIDGDMAIFQEEMAVNLKKVGVNLFDRWVVTKRGGFPFRGRRVPSRFEFVTLFTSWPQNDLPRSGLSKFATTIDAERHPKNPNAKTAGTMPYSGSIPRQLFQAYGQGGPVLDPFVGTGTSLIEAARLGLDGVGVEIDPTIAEIAVQRVKEEAETEAALRV